MRTFSSRSSRYLPVLDPSTTRSSSLSSQDKLRGQDPNGRQSDKGFAKRRATMNSRDAAYDEDEMLRQAIEESKETGTLGKRSREDSEEYVQP